MFLSIIPIEITIITHRQETIEAIEEEIVEIEEPISTITMVDTTIKRVVDTTLSVQLIKDLKMLAEEILAQLTQIIVIEKR